jgi:hypothetical protein
MDQETKKFLLEMKQKHEDNINTNFL